MPGGRRPRCAWPPGAPPWSSCARVLVATGRGLAVRPADVRPTTCRLGGRGPAGRDGHRRPPARSPSRRAATCWRSRRWAWPHGSSGPGGLAAAVDRVTPAVVRRIVAGGTGAGLVLGTLVASLPAPDLRRPPDASTATASPAATRHHGARPSGDRHDDPATTPGPRGRRGDHDAAWRTRPRRPTPATPSATMTRVGRRRPAEPVAAAAGHARRRPRRPALPAAPALPAVDAATWVVEPGDSLWSIAEDVVRPPRPEAADRDGDPLLAAADRRQPARASSTPTTPTCWCPASSSSCRRSTG